MSALFAATCLPLKVIAIPGLPSLKFCDDPLCQQELQERKCEVRGAILTSAREGIGKFFKAQGGSTSGIPSVLI